MSFPSKGLNLPPFYRKVFSMVFAANSGEWRKMLVKEEFAYVLVCKRYQQLRIACRLTPFVC